MKQLESEGEFCRSIMIIMGEAAASLYRGPALSRYRPALENTSPAGGSDGTKSSWHGVSYHGPGGTVYPCPAYWDLCERLFLSRAPTLLEVRQPDLGSLALLKKKGFPIACFESQRGGSIKVSCNFTRSMGIGAEK